ncbi:MAG: LysM peptidoglycan-binding domain-containing protein [Phototrophicaceae bacterium]
MKLYTRRIMARCLGWGFLVLIIAGCSLSSPSTGEPRVVYITATFPPATAVESTPVPAMPSVQATPVDLPPAVPQPGLSPVPQSVAFAPTPNPERFTLDQGRADSHTVRPGDTLYGIAAAYGASLDALLAVNDLPDPNALSVGQVLALPDLPTMLTPGFKLVPDGRLVRGPGSSSFDVRAFVAGQPGYIRLVTDEVDTRQADGSAITEVLTGAQIVERISIEYSLDARLLLALTEYLAGWLSNPAPPEERRARPFNTDREGFYRQLAWLANQVNAGYYGWRYRGWTTLEFSGTERYLYAPGLNAGTVALQYVLALHLDPAAWARAVNGVQGFYSTYYAYFGDPFAGVVDPVVPPDLTQPPLLLPFAQGEVWYFTGGAHGGWASGSAWAAVDFAPPDERQDGVFCFVSAYWVRAVADGVIARSEDGAVVLDLDGDGDESTGWTIFYLHIAEQDRVPVGARVRAGDPIGRASCEGGFSTATHLHIGRRYNGEWLPSDCFVCAPHDSRPPFDMGGWTVVGIRNQEYQGYLDRGGERRTAEQGRVSLVNRIAW